jgi:hypothetical protein
VAETWAPALDDVARHIPRRTRDTMTPGSDQTLGTFTSATTPTDAQAQAVIDDAVSAVLAAAGPVPVTGQANAALVQQAARTAAEWRAAADIEIAYPVRDADVLLVDRLNARAAAAMTALLTVMATTQTGAIEPVPVWMSPDPPPWADTSPGSGTETVAGFGTAPLSGVV